MSITINVQQLKMTRQAQKCTIIPEERYSEYLYEGQFELKRIKHTAYYLP